MERREGKDWIGLRIRYKGKITDLYINQLADGRLMHSNSWIEADGWFTDAYMFAVTYEAGMEPADSKERFICYGSALRRGDVSFFSSLAKLFVIQKEEKRADEIVDGWSTEDECWIQKRETSESGCREWKGNSCSL